MRNKVLGFIEKNSLIDKGDSIIIALSGGADSVSLFHFLLSLREQYDLKLYAFHLNHMLRGDDADRDMNFVRRLCDENGVRSFIVSQDIAGIAKKEKISTETAGRNIRYRYLKELSTDLCAKIATAHTQSDNAETVIFNLARGASLKGISGIPVKRDNIIRPLLCVTREEIEDYCESEGLSYVTDETNFEDIYTRNRIRHKVIPVLRDINDDFFTAVQRLTEISAETVKYIDDIAEKEKSNAKLSYGYDANRIASLDDAVRHEVLIKMLEEHDISPSFDMIQGMDEALKNKSSIDIYKGYSFSGRQGIARIIHERSGTYSEIPFKDYQNIRVLDRSEIDKLSDHEKRFLIDTDKITDDAVIRNRRSGDTFRLPKRKITKSIKKLLNEEKIPLELRDDLMIVSDRDRILYCEMIGASEYGMTDKKTKNAVIIYK